MGPNEIPDELFNLSVNELHGPYSENGYLKSYKINRSQAHARFCLMYVIFEPGGWGVGYERS
jgi:hypothetical protein